MRYVVGCLALPVMLFAVIVVWILFPPADNLQIGCRVTHRYQVQATVEVDGQRASGEAVVVALAERFRHGQLFSWSGCQSTEGQAIAFRLRDNRALLMRADVCAEAKDVLDAEGEVDAGAICHTPARRRARQSVDEERRDIYVIDNADAPSEWRSVYFDEGEVKLVRLHASRVWFSGASDQLEAVAPALLSTRYEDSGTWSSPAALISNARRDGRSDRYLAAMVIPDESERQK